MSKFVAIISLALILSVAIAAPAASSATPGSSAFNSTPVLVFSVANSTDAKTAWPAYSGSTPTSAGVQVNGVVFGPGSDNTTLWAYGLTYSTPSTTATITAVEQRKLNASIVAAGTDTTEMSDIMDYQATLGTAIPTLRTPVLAVGPGYFAAVTLAQTGSGPYTQQININIWTAGTTTPATVTIASGADVASTSTQDYNVNSVWYEGGYFYVCYSSVTGAISGQTTTYTEAGIYVQGVAAASGNAVLYKSPMAAFTSTTATIATYSRTAGGTVLYPKAGPSNYTNSTYINVVYKTPIAAKSVATLIPVTRSTGAPGTAVTLTTDNNPGASAAGQTWTPVGTFYSNYTYGALLAYINASSSAASATNTYGLTYCYNNTCSDTGMTFASATGAVAMAYGTPFNTTGYVIWASYPTSSSSSNYVEQSYWNGTATSTSVTTIASVAGTANAFVDTNNALWFGYASYDTNSAASAYSVYAGYIGRLLYNIFPTTTTSFGNVLASFFAFLTLLLASLFAF